MIYFQKSSETIPLTEQELRDGMIEGIEKFGPVKRVLAIPPDITRFHSYAGVLTQIVDENLGDRLSDILPALGTHAPMTELEIKEMYGKIDLNKFRVHNWREDVVTVGEVPADFVQEVSEQRVNYPWKAQLNKILLDPSFDMILSIGQVVPHEVVGMANYNKNIFVGTGGPEGINKSHFLGAAYGMERMMGRADTPVRKVLNYASEHFTSDLPIVYVQTVVGRADNGELKVFGLFIGDDEECFMLAAELSLKLNFTMLDTPLDKVVVYLDPGEFKSTWLGNKSIYRTRMALADEGELVVLAPGVAIFGEDKEIDRLIRKYGYATTPEILEWTENNEDLNNNLSAAAHLIHGSSEGRFRITYCPGHLSREEVESVHFNYAGLDEMMKKYDPEKLMDGFNTMPDGEEIYFISNPAVGLWAYRGRFK